MNLGSIRTLLAVMAICFELMSSASATAGFMTIHDAVLTSILPPDSIAGSGALDTGWRSESDALGSQTARAATGGNFGALLRTFASYDTRYGDGFTSTKNASAIASHFDAVYFNGPSPAPDVIRLNFHFDGQFASELYSKPDRWNNIVNLYVWITGPNEFWALGTGANGVGPSSFDRLSLDGSRYDGTFHMDISNNGYNVYPWQLSMQSFANGAFSAGSTDFFNTTSLMSVTLPDGTPVSDISFDSGLTLQANQVPEPSTLVLCITGMALGLWRRRSKRPNAT